MKISNEQTTKVALVFNATPPEVAKLVKCFLSQFDRDVGRHEIFGRIGRSGRCSVHGQPIPRVHLRLELFNIRDFEVGRLVDVLNPPTKGRHGCFSAASRVATVLIWST